MFHLIKKYSNRKLYDTFSKKFITLDELLKLLLKKEEIRIEDSDSHIDITDLEVSKAIMRYINNGNKLPETLSKLLAKIQEEKKKKQKEKLFSKIKNQDEMLTDILGTSDEVIRYVPAEIRLLNKSMEYLQGAKAILMDEAPYNIKLHDELYVLYKEFERKLSNLKKKHRLS